ncbi:hypothetical protein VYU27_008878 [Nannochloropsis oceanica]
MGRPTLIKGVILDLSLLLRLSSGGLPLVRTATPAAGVDSSALSSRQRPLLPEDELERRIRLEMFGSGFAGERGGGAVGRGGGLGSQMQQQEAEGKTDMISTLARTLGVTGFESGGGGGRDPREAFSSAIIASSSTVTSTASSLDPVCFPGAPAHSLFPFSSSASFASSSSSSSSPTADVRNKYLARLRAKGQNQKHNNSSNNSSSSNGSRDNNDLAIRHNRVRRLMEARDGGRDGGREGGSEGGRKGGLLTSSVMDVLDYMTWRGLRLGLIPRGRKGLTSEVLMGARQGGKEGGMEGGRVRFEAIPALGEGEEEEDEEEEHEEGETRRRRREREEVRWLCEELGIIPREMLMVTAESTLVEVGRSEGCFTCLVSARKGEGKGGGRGEEHYQVTAWEELQWVIEDLNGISYRQR